MNPKALLEEPAPTPCACAAVAPRSATGLLEAAAMKPKALGASAGGGCSCSAAPPSSLGRESAPDQVPGACWMANGALLAVAPAACVVTPVRKPLSSPKDSRSPAPRPPPPPPPPLLLPWLPPPRIGSNPMAGSSSNETSIKSGTEVAGAPARDPPAGPHLGAPPPMALWATSDKTRAGPPAVARTLTFAPDAGWRLISSSSCERREGRIASWSGSTYICIQRESGGSSSNPPLRSTGNSPPILCNGTQPPRARSAAKPTRPERMLASGICASASNCADNSSNSWLTPLATALGSKPVTARNAEFFVGTMDVSSRTRSRVSSAKRGPAAKAGAPCAASSGKEQSKPERPKRRILELDAGSVQGDTLAPKASPSGSRELTSVSCTFRRPSEPKAAKPAAAAASGEGRPLADSTTTSRRRPSCFPTICAPGDAHGRLLENKAGSK
mmetsp:Transcript_101532/g.255835  ORF Transcript_101532/g.255835 Transcript_101532/m.255835 type:complete len:443 (+) Transcript_101532:311-1639(+)